MACAVQKGLGPRLGHRGRLVQADKLPDPTSIYLEHAEPNLLRRFCMLSDTIQFRVGLGATGASVRNRFATSVREPDQYQCCEPCHSWRSQRVI